MDRTLLSKDKLKQLRVLLYATSLLPGANAEVGVYRGGVAKLISLLCPDKDLYIFDTFCGILGSTEADYHKNGEFACSREEVVRFIGFDKLHVYEGLFPDSIGTDELPEFSFVHSDTDTYLGTKATLDVFLPKMVAGGIILFDDWLWPNCPGVTTVLSEYVVPNGYKYDSYGHQLWITKL